jgi:hypothetical protein
MAAPQAATRLPDQKWRLERSEKLGTPNSVRSGFERVPAHADAIGLDTVKPFAAFDLTKHAVLASSAG